MSSNPHNLTLTSSYSRIYDEIAKLSKLNVESAAAIKPENNISVKTNYTTLTPYLTREDLGFDSSPKKNNHNYNHNHRSKSSSKSSDDSSSDSSSSSSRSSSSSSSSRSSRKKHKHKHKHRHHHRHKHHHHKDKHKSDKSDKDKNNKENKDKNNNKKEDDKSAFKYVRKTNEQWFKEKLSGSNSQNNDYLNKKRDYLTRKEKEEKIEMEASMKIDKMLDEIRREKRVKQMIKERQEQLQKKLKEKDGLKAKPKKKKMEKKKKTSNFFLEAMGVTEEEMNKKMEEEILNEKENDKNIFSNTDSSSNTMGYGPVDFSALLLRQENRPKYYNFQVKHGDIYKRVLSFEFYNSKLKTENIPDFFDNEQHYRYIWVPDFFNELKYCLLNEKAEKSDMQNYLDADIKIQIHYQAQEYDDIDVVGVFTNKNLMDLKKKILKDKDILAIYPENEKINFEDINISNKNNLNYFLAVVKREIDSYETKLLIHKKDMHKFRLNNTSYKTQSNSKKDNTPFFKIKYLNNINSSLREFNAILSLELSCFKDILNPKKLLLTSNKNNEPEKGPILEPIPNGRRDDFIKNIKFSNIYNSSQIDVLSKANNMKKNELLLIQGPPGTGKTHTILGLVSLFMLNPRTRILICAQSNTAIDEICYRLVNKGLYDERLNNIKSNFIRFGYTDRKDREKKYLDTKRGKMLEKYSLEYLTDRKFKEKLENANLEKEQIMKETNLLLEDKIKNAERLKILENKRQTLMKALSKNKYEKQNYEYYLLSNTPILCTTLNNAGNERLKKNKLTYDFLIIDEACQCVEPSSLIPLCHGIKNLILVGDHKQLPATVFYPKAKSILYNRSLFERLIDNNIPRHILTIQYRMQTNIRKFISNLFYDNKLQDSPDENYIGKINNNMIYKIIDINKNFSYFDINFSEESMDNSMKSYYNWTEIDFVYLLMKRINNNLRKIYKDREYKYAVITPYQAQVKKFKEEKYNYRELSEIDLAINTVDSFQGQERDIVIFSTVRSNNKNNNNNTNNDVIGFMSDFRRMNVALSRAKFGCFIVGNSQKFKNDPYWEKLINFCQEKNCLFNIKNKDEFNNCINNVFVDMDRNNY